HVDSFPWSTACQRCSLARRPGVLFPFLSITDPASTEIYTLSLHDALPIFERLGDPHPVLGSLGLYVPQDNRAELTRRCLRLLAELGLATDEVLAPRFRDTLLTLAEPGRELYCWSSFADPAHDRACLVAEREGEAVALSVHEDTVTLRPIDPRHLVEEFVTTLPQTPPAPVRPL